MNQSMHTAIVVTLCLITWYGFLSKHPIMQKETRKWEEMIRKFLNL